MRSELPVRRLTARTDWGGGSGRVQQMSVTKYLDGSARPRTGLSARQPAARCRWLLYQLAPCGCAAWPSSAEPTLSAARSAAARRELLIPFAPCCFRKSYRWANLSRTRRSARSGSTCSRICSSGKVTSPWPPSPLSTLPRRLDERRTLTACRAVIVAMAYRLPIHQLMGLVHWDQRDHSPGHLQFAGD